MKMLLTLFKTNDSFTTLIARLTLGLVTFPHGAQKALGLFGGYGFSATMKYTKVTWQHFARLSLKLFEKKFLHIIIL